MPKRHAVMPDQLRHVDHSNTCTPYHAADAAFPTGRALNAKIVI